jgi:hypothetical protein
MGGTCSGEYTGVGQVGEGVGVGGASERGSGGRSDGNGCVPQCAVTLCAPPLGAPPLCAQRSASTFFLALPLPPSFSSAALG